MTVTKGNSTSVTSPLNTNQCIADPNWIYDMHQWTNKKGPHSQGSQDLYLEKIFQVISPTNKYFVEFGFNEPSYSTKGSGANTHNLYEKGWRGLLLDGHHENKMINLKKYYLFANNIGSIFTENNVPKEPDFISCDMDSHDLWVIRSILQAGYRPRIITTEFNSNYHITDALTLLDPTVNCSGSLPKNFKFRFQQCAWGASAGALRIVAESHGYTMVGRVRSFDLIWIRNDLLKDCFRIPPFEWFFHDAPIGKIHHKPVSSADVLKQIVDYDTYVRTLNIEESNIAARAILKSRDLPCFNNVSKFL